MKYALYIDYKKNGKYEYFDLHSADLEEAIEAADELVELEGGNEAVYLARIMKKVGKITAPEKGLKQVTFEAILCKRSHGWHRNTKENGENEHIATRTSDKYGAWYEAV